MVIFEMLSLNCEIICSSIILHCSSTPRFKYKLNGYLVLMLSIKIPLIPTVIFSAKFNLKIIEKMKMVWKKLFIKKIYKKRQKIDY